MSNSDTEIINDCRRVSKRMLEEAMAPGGAVVKRKPGRGAVDFGRELLPALWWVGEVGTLRFDDRVLRVEFHHSTTTTISGLRLSMVSLTGGEIDASTLWFDDVAPERESNVAGVDIRGDEQVIVVTDEPTPDRRWTWYAARPKTIEPLRAAVIAYAIQWREPGRSRGSVIERFREDAVAP